MKKLLSLLAATSFVFLGTSISSDARPYGGHYDNRPSQIFAGYYKGRPVYKQLTRVGIDRFGRPRYEYRTVSSRYRGYSNSYRSNRYQNNHCSPRYSRQRSYYNGYNGYNRYNRGSGASINFRFGR